MRKVEEGEFDDFIAASEYKTLTVPQGPMSLIIYYDEEEYDANKRDAYRYLGNPSGDVFFIKG